MHPRPSPPQFEDLLRSVLDGAGEDATPLQALEEAMLKDDGRRSEYLDQMEIDALLAWEFGGQAGSQLDRKPVARPRGARWRIFQVAAPLAAAAAVTILFGAGFYLGRQTPGPSPAAAPVVAVLIEAEDCVWVAENGHEPAFGSAFTGGGSLHIASGVARLAMRSRAGIAVEGPASVDLLSAEVVRVRHGRVSAYAPDEAIGFKLITPGVEIVDLGTRFAASVEQDGTTDVHVFEGEISVQGRQEATPGSSAEVVTTGQAWRYAADGGRRTEIDIAPERFAEPPDLEQLLAATQGGRQTPPKQKTTPGLRAVLGAGSDGSLLAFQDFTLGEGDLNGSFSGSGFSSQPWLANSSFTRLIPSVASPSGEAHAGGYLLVRGRDKAEPFVANRIRRELAAPLPESFFWAIRASYHGLDADDFFSLWTDTHGREDASHSNAPTIGIREGRFFARLDLEHTAVAGPVADGQTFVLVGHHRWDAVENRARIALWVDPADPGAAPAAEADGPVRFNGPQAYRFIGLRMGQYTEVSDRLMVHAMAMTRSFETALAALQE